MADADPDGAPGAAAALCGLYHEAAQQLRRLQDQLAARDALIARLRARLAALDGDAAPSLVDALLDQVARFREQLRRQEGGAAETRLHQLVWRMSVTNHGRTETFIISQRPYVHRSKKTGLKPTRESKWLVRLLSPMAESTTSRSWNPGLGGRSSQRDC